MIGQKLRLAAIERYRKEIARLEEDLKEAETRHFEALKGCEHTKEDGSTAVIGGMECDVCAICGEFW